MSSHSIPDTPPTHTKDDIRKLIKAMGGRPISFNRAYAKIAGSVEAGLMLAQGVHWSGQADKDGWFFRTQADWEEDTTMSPDQQRTARRKLRPIKHGDQHLWQEKEQGLPKQLFFRVDMDVLAELIIKTEPSSASDRDLQSQGFPTSSDRDSRGLFIGNPDSINKDDEMKDEMKDEMSSFSSGDEQKTPPKKRPRKTPVHDMPANWKPSDTARKWARDKGVDDKTIDYQAEKFTDYHLSSAKQFADWDRAFQTWIRNGIEWERIIPKKVVPQELLADMHTPINNHVSARERMIQEAKEREQNGY